MPIIQPGRSGGIQGRGYLPMCGQGGKRVEFRQGLRRPFPSFRSEQFSGSYVLSGVTRDVNGTPLTGVTVKLFSASNDCLIARTVSDGVGAYSFPLGNNGPVYIVAYLDGTPDVAGTTINELVPASL